MEVGKVGGSGAYQSAPDEANAAKQTGQTAAKTETAAKQTALDAPSREAAPQTTPAAKNAAESANVLNLRESDQQSRYKVESNLNGVNALANTATDKSAAGASKAAVPGFKAKIGEASEIGAYYHKVVTNPSAESLTLATTGAIAPQVQTENARYLFGDTRKDADGKTVVAAVNFAEANKNGITLAEMNDPSATGPKDRPSIYMGGNSNKVEVDAGLAWNRVVAIKDGKSGSTWTTAANGSSRTDQYFITEQGTGKDKVFVATPLFGDGKPTTGKTFAPNADGSVTIGDKLLRPNFAFRPFFRSTDRQNVNSGYHSKFLTPGGDNDVQIYAGEKFDMSISSAKGSNNVKLEIKTENNDFSYNPAVAGFRGAKGTAAATLKRVDSIDQKGKEKGLTDATKTKVSDGAWGATSVTIGKTNVPLVGTAGTHVASPEFQNNKNELSIFSPDNKPRATDAKGGEPIYINPAIKK